MIRIKVANSILIIEDRLGILERDFMLSYVFAVFPLVPFEPDFSHMYIVRMLDSTVNAAFGGTLADILQLLPLATRNDTILGIMTTWAKSDVVTP
jgi:hypothetical protein